jgi:hypothetical protein
MCARATPARHSLYNFNAPLARRKIIGPFLPQSAPYRAKAVDLGAHMRGVPRTFHAESVSKRRNTMNEESQKIEKIEKAEQTEQVKAAELSEQELDNIAGGATKTVSSSKSNTSSF